MKQDKDLPESDAGISGGDYGMAIKKDDLRRGYFKTDGHEVDGDEIYGGISNEPGGFLDRSHGWDR